MSPALSPQQLHLQLIRHASFNRFNGDLVADFLERRPDLWRAALMDRPGYEAGEISPIKLRDLVDDEWNVDTLYLVAARESAANELAELALAVWGADEADVLPHTVGGPSLPVVRIWWD